MAGINFYNNGTIKAIDFSPWGGIDGFLTATGTGSVADGRELGGARHPHRGADQRGLLASGLACRSRVLGPGQISRLWRGAQGFSFAS